MDYDICTRLAAARKKAGKSQKSVCDDLHIPNVQTLSNYENNINDPSVDRLCALIDYYGVSADWVLFGDKNRQDQYSSNKDRILSLLSLLDELVLRIEPEYGFSGMETGRYIINLSDAPREGYQELFDAVYKYRNLLSESNLSVEDYQTLVRAKVNAVSVKTKDFAPCVPPEFPSVEAQINQFIANEEVPF